MPTLIKFFKYEGAGNDFILIEDFDETLPPLAISTLCDRKRGIGADGLILARRSNRADFKMVFYNADSSLGSMCGNGLRCFVHFLRDLGIQHPLYRIEVGKSLLTVKVEGDTIFTYLQEPKVLKWSDGVCVVDTGALHAVVFAKGPVDVLSEGEVLRHDKSLHEEGVNVNFAWKKGEDAFFVRTFEKGVEGETLACGTGAAAVAFVAKEKGLAKEKVYIHTLSSEVLKVQLTKEVEVVGPSRRVFEGYIEQDAKFFKK